MEDILTLVKSASRDLASAKHYLTEAEKQEGASAEAMGKLRKLGLEHFSASATLRCKKETFITSLCKAAYWMLGMKKYVLKHKQSGVESITLTDDDGLCIHLVTHPRNRCIVDYPRFLAGDEFSDAFFFFCERLTRDVESFLRGKPEALTMQSEGLSRLLAQVSKLKATETKVVRLAGQSE